MPDGAVVNYDGVPDTSFRLIFPKLPWVVLFMQGFQMPGFRVQEVTRVTPYVDMNEIGEKIVYEPFTVTYFVDSGLKNYKSVYDWTKRMSVAGTSVGESSEAILVINGVEMIRFNGCWPMSTTGFNFETTGSDVNYLRASTTFNYDYYEFLNDPEPIYMNN
jgi:hypothetical protein